MRSSNALVRQAESVMFAYDVVMIVCKALGDE